MDHRERSGEETRRKKDSLERGRGKWGTSMRRVLKVSERGGAIGKAETRVVKEVSEAEGSLPG